MLTIAELIAGFDVELLAGRDGLDRPVRWVHISELPDPTPWLSGGELLLTTGMKLDGSGDDYIGRLADHGLAGLGVGVHTGAGVDEIPEPMVAEAERRGFPLFTVPRELPFIALTEKASTHIVNEQYALLQRAAAAQERLERIVLSERGLGGIAEALARLVGGTAAIVSSDGSLLAGSGPEVQELRARLARRDPDALVLRVRGDAWLTAARSGEPLTELDRLIVRQAVTTVALELLRLRVAAETERRLGGDVLASMLSGELEGAELRRRLEPFGLGDRVAAIAFPLGEGVVDSLESALRRLGIRGLAAAAGGVTCAMVAAPPGDEELFRLARRLGEEVGASAGAGRPVPSSDARRTFHEARWALASLGTGANGEGAAVGTYRDLGSFQLLLSLQDDEALRLFCESILAPIEDGEGAYGGELMRSLEAFIECNGQWERAARKLYCHRHTLRYRIRRVEELTGRSLESARDRIDFWLALRGRELLH